MTNSSSERPQEYWMALARMGFEDDLHRLMERQGISQADLARATGTSEAYISQVLNGSDKNFTLKTLVKLARPLQGLVQIRLVVDGEEVVRTMDVETARWFDDQREKREPRSKKSAPSGPSLPALPLAASSNQEGG